MLNYGSVDSPLSDIRFCLTANGTEVCLPLVVATTSRSPLLFTWICMVADLTGSLPGLESSSCPAMIAAAVRLDLAVVIF